MAALTELGMTVIHCAESNYFCVLQTCMWSSWHSVFSESRTAFSCYFRCTIPLLSFREYWSIIVLPFTDGHLFTHVNVFQSAGPPAPGAKWDFRLAQETTVAQVLSCLQTTHNGEGRLVYSVGEQHVFFKN